MAKKATIVDNLNKSFVDNIEYFGKHENADIANIGAHRNMVAGRINESLTKGLDVAAVETSNKKLTPVNATSIKDIATLIKSGEWEFFSLSDISKFNTALRKSFDEDEIDRAEWEAERSNVNQLKSTIVKSLQGDEVTVYYRKKQVNNTLSKSVKYEQRLEEIRKQMMEEVYTDNSETFNKALTNDLEKGDITDKFAYGYGSGNEAMKFNKTGKEIKEVMPVVIAALNTKKVEIETAMQTAMVAAGTEPTEVYNSGNFKTITLKRYPWEMTSAKYDDVAKVTIPMTDAQTACRTYNDLCYEMRSVLEDIATCSIIADNVVDKKSYTLTVSQLVALSFAI